MKIKKDRIQLFFDYVDSGFKKSSEDLKEFEIAGEDKVFYPAEATVNGKTLIVPSSKVKKTIAVRFAWKPVPKPN